MRYILKDGYIDEISFGATIECKNQTCIEYAGTIPTGYENLVEWAIGEEGKLNAWKIVDDDLVFDSTRYARLQKIYAKEEKENSFITNKQLKEYLYGTTKQVSDQYASRTTDDNKIHCLKNTKALSLRLNIKPYELITGSLNVVATTKNMLINEALQETINGMIFTPNEDRSVNVSGTSSTITEYNISGTSTNTSAFFVFKKGVNYYLSSNSHQIKMYYYDGTDKAEVYSGTGGIITFTDSDKLVTQIVLSLPAGTYNEDVYLQLELGTEASEYVTNEHNNLFIDLQNYQFNRLGLFASPSLKASTSAKVSAVNIDYIEVSDKDIYLNKNNNKYFLGEDTINAFDNTTIIFTLENTYFTSEYKINALGGTFIGDVYDKEETEILGSRGLITALQYSSVGQYNGFSILGFMTGAEGNYTFHYGDISLDIEIPENFVVTEAYITLFHLPIYWHGVVGSTSFNTWGNARNVKLYKVNGNEDYYFEAGYLSSLYFNLDEGDTISKTEITNAMGVNGFTGERVENNITEVFKSNNIAQSINKTGRHKLFLRSSDSIPTGTGNNKTASEKTALGKAILDIYGYMKYEKESE